MYQIYGLNHNKRILPVNAEGTDEISPAGLVTRRVDVGSNILANSTSVNRVAIGNFTNTFTFPAGNFIYEINNISGLYDTGTGTVAFLYASIGGVFVTLDTSNALPINTTLKYFSSMLVNPNDTVNFNLQVTVQPCNMILRLAYIRIPFTP